MHPTPSHSLHPLNELSLSLSERPSSHSASCFLVGAVSLPQENTALCGLVFPVARQKRACLINDTLPWLPGAPMTHSLSLGI